MIENIKEKYTVENVNLNIQKNFSGKIKIRELDKSRIYIKLTFTIIIVLTILGLTTFDYKGINFKVAILETLENLKVMVFNAKLSSFSLFHGLKQISITMGLGFITTILGGLIALFISFFAAKNLGGEKTSNIIKYFVALIRAVPTVLWVLIFAISMGLGAEAAVVGLSLHTIGYLIKAYSEVFEEISEGTIEALKAGGAGFWHIIFQAVIPSTMRSLIAWTFMRFEINFTNAVAMGAAAGAGGIGFEMFMSSNFYFNINEVGAITIAILLTAIILEYSSTVLKRKYFT